MQNQTDAAKRMEKNRFFSWYVERVNILFYFVFNLEMLPSSTMNISVFTYIFMSKGSDGNDQPDQPPPISKHHTIFACFFFFFLPLVFFIKPSVKPQTLLINTHWKRGRGGGGMRQIHIITVNRRKTQYRGKQNNTLTKKKDIKPMK